MPPWISREECDDVPAPKSALSISAVRNPRDAASRAIPAPVMPPPMMSTSTGVSTMEAKAAARVCSNSPPLGAGGRFRFPGRGEESNAESQRSSRGCHRRRAYALCQSRHGAEGRACRGSRALRRARAARTHQSGWHRRRRSHLWSGRAIGARAEYRTRSESAAAVSQRDPRLFVESRVRLGQSGDHSRAGSDRPGARECDHRGRRRSAVGHSHSGLATTGGHPGRSEQGQVPPRARQDVRQDSPERPRTGGARDRGAIVQRDNGIRADTSLEQMAKLKPVFDRRYGSVTAANSSPLTDGASAVLLMGDDTARTMGYEPLAFIRSYAVAAVDPGWQLLQAPVWAVPKALERAGIQWKELGLIELHEAFASQVLSNLQGFAAKGWEINEDIINVMGGSIAIGHPFGATGGRLVTTLSNEMRRRDVQYGLISVCAQGGMGFAMVLERR